MTSLNLNFNLTPLSSNSFKNSPVSSKPLAVLRLVSGHSPHSLSTVSAAHLPVIVTEEIPIGKPLPTHSPGLMERLPFLLWPAADLATDD